MERIQLRLARLDREIAAARAAAAGNISDLAARRHAAMAKLHELADVASQETRPHD
jgi:hypothetical protein